MAKQKKHVMVAYSGEAKDVLLDVLKDNLSPEAVAVIAAYLGVPAAVYRGGVPLQPGRCGDEQVDLSACEAQAGRQVQWFAEQLVEALGGDDAFSRVCDELGW